MLSEETQAWLDHVTAEVDRKHPTGDEWNLAIHAMLTLFVMLLTVLYWVSRTYWGLK